MVRGAWQATVHGIERVRHDLVTKQEQQQTFALLTVQRNCLSSVGTNEGGDLFLICLCILNMPST